MLNEVRRLPNKILIEVQMGDVLTFNGCMIDWNFHNKLLCKAFINAYPGYRWSYVPSENLTHLFKTLPEYQKDDL